MLLKKFVDKLRIGLRTYHKSFIIESSLNGQNQNEVMLKFVLFGAYGEMCLKDSFYEIDVDIEIENDTLASDSSIINCKYNTYNHYRIDISCDYDNIAEIYIFISTLV